MVVKMKLCLICKKYISEQNFIEHFKECRKKQQESAIKQIKQIPQKDGTIVYKMRKPCNCGKKKT